MTWRLWTRVDQKPKSAYISLGAEPTTLGVRPSGLLLHGTYMATLGSYQSEKLNKLALYGNVKGKLNQSFFDGRPVM